MQTNPRPKHWHLGNTERTTVTQAGQRTVACAARARASSARVLRSSARVAAASSVAATSSMRARRRSLRCTGQAGEPVQAALGRR